MSSFQSRSRVDSPPLLACTSVKPSFASMDPKEEQLLRDHSLKRQGRRAKGGLTGGQYFYNVGNIVK